MKHMHMLMAFVTIALFLWQSYKLLTANKHPDKKQKIITHTVYLLLVVSGVITVMPLISLDVPLQWVVAKFILLIAAISASTKAFKHSATKPQSKMGILIASVAYIAIVAIAFIKPNDFI